MELEPNLGVELDTPVKLAPLAPPNTALYYLLHCCCFYLGIMDWLLDFSFPKTTELLHTDFGTYDGRQVVDSFERRPGNR